MLRICVFFLFLSSTVVGQSLVDMGLSHARISVRPEFSFREGNIYIDTRTGLYSKSVSSTDTVWTKVSPEGTFVSSYVFNGDSILIITDGGAGDCMKLTTNNGDTWNNYTNGFGGSFSDFESATELSQSPADPLTIYGMAGNCAAKSTDFGKNWTVVKNAWGHISYQPVIMRVHPLKPNVVLSGGEAGNFHSYLDISYNAGSSWTQHDVEANNAVNCVGFHPADPAIMFTGKEGAIHRSIDSGQTWTKVFSPPHEMYIRAIDYPYSYSDDVYAVGAYNSVSFPKDSIHIFRSGDKGLHWEKIHQQYLPRCGGIAEMEIFDSSLYFMTFHSGIYKLDLKTLPVGIDKPTIPVTDFNIQLVQENILVSGIEKNISSISIFNIQGQVLFQSGIAARSFSVNTQSWKNGLYIVRIESDHSLYSEKILISR